MSYQGKNPHPFLPALALNTPFPSHEYPTPKHQLPRDAVTRGYQAAEQRAGGSEVRSFLHQTAIRRAKCGSRQTARLIAKCLTGTCRSKWGVRGHPLPQSPSASMEQDAGLIDASVWLHLQGKLNLPHPFP